MAVQNFISRVGPAVSALWFNTADYFQQAPTSTGTGTAFVVAYPGRTVPFVLVDGMVVKFRANADCGVSPTLDVASTGAKAIRNRDGISNTGANAFRQNEFVWVQYRSTNDSWILVEQTHFTSLLAFDGGTFMDYSGTTLRVGGTGGTWTAISMADALTITGVDGNGVALILQSSTATSFGVISIRNARVGASFNTLLNCTNQTDADWNVTLSEVGAATKFSRIGPSVNIPMEFVVNNTVQGRLDATGRWIFGANAGFGGSVRVDIYGATTTCLQCINDTAASFNSAIWNRATAGNNAFLEFATEAAYTQRGSITYNRGAGLTAYNTTSDSRLKTTINRGAVGIDSKIDQIQVHQYSWKSTGFVGIGCYAQELEAIAPEAVTPGDTGQEIVSAWGVDYSKLVPRLILEVQRLRRRVEVLEAANAMTIPKS